MITDNQGAKVDDAVALLRLVVDRDLRFPDDNLPGDRLGRLFAQVGELADLSMTIEQGPPFPTANPGAALTGALFDVLHAAGGIAHHYQLPLHLPDSKGYLRAYPAPELLAWLTQAGGALARIVGHRVQTVRERRGVDSAGNAADEMSRRVDLVMIRTLMLAEHYGLRHDLRTVIQVSYRKLQNEGYLW